MIISDIPSKNILDFYLATSAVIVLMTKQATSLANIKTGTASFIPWSKFYSLKTEKYILAYYIRTTLLLHPLQDEQTSAVTRKHSSIVQRIK